MDTFISKIKIIAEIGINHDGIYDQARELIAEAAGAGVDAVKFQYRNLENSYFPGASHEIGDEILIQEIRKAYLPPERLYELARYAQSLGLEAGISFFDVCDLLDFGTLISNFDFFKTPSAELTNTALIDSLISLDRHLYISTGCQTEDHIEASLGRLQGTGWTPMHCISNYPLSLQNAKLGYITHLRRRWGRAVGYSSHDECWEACLLALQLGVSVIERHITLDQKARGLDHSSSSTPKQFVTLCEFAKNIDAMLGGDGPRVPNQGELLNKQNLGRSFFAAVPLPRGHLLDPSDLVYRSPNIGLSSTDIGSYIGRPIMQPVEKGAALVSSMFEAKGSLTEPAVEFARLKRLSLPVRLHDIWSIQHQFPIGSYEFHLSFMEVLSNIDISGLDSGANYSIHLPDYINPTQLLDPFASSKQQRVDSLSIVERTVELAERLQTLTKREVPIVGSFSNVHNSKKEFYSSHNELFHRYSQRGVTLIPQWLPPIAWYFGGSVKLQAMNDLRDSEFLREYGMGFCLDVCHMIMGRNYFGFIATDLVEQLAPLVRHVHIADAQGIDGEGLEFGKGEPENLELIGRALEFNCIKVIEVWQGHLNQGAGFRQAIMRLEELYGR
jgi:sialic acid synthase SpsE/sugar phosphate isomerase/epimerase